jgi:hypothetical protein
MNHNQLMHYSSATSSARLNDPEASGSGRCSGFCHIERSRDAF